MKFMKYRLFRSFMFEQFCVIARPIFGRSNLGYLDCFAKKRLPAGRQARNDTTAKILLVLLLFSVFFDSGICVMAGESRIDFFANDDKIYQNIVVEKVLSADTILLDNDETIKLIGLQGPPAPKRAKDVQRDEHGFIIEEKVDPAAPVEDQAFAFVKKLLLGQHVRLEFDVEKKNNEFKTTAYVFLVKDNTFANAEILRLGYASLHITPPNTKYAGELREAYKEARREQRGLQAE